MYESNIYPNEIVKNQSINSNENQPEDHKNLNLLNSNFNNKENLKNKKITEKDQNKILIFPDIFCSDVINLDKYNNCQIRFCEKEIGQIIIKNSFDYFGDNNENIINEESEDEEVVVEILDDENSETSVSVYDNKPKNCELKYNEDKFKGLYNDNYFYHRNLIPNQNVYLYMFNDDSYNPVFNKSINLTPICPKFAEKYLLPWTQANIFNFPPNQISFNNNLNDFMNSFNLNNTSNNTNDINNISININSTVKNSANTNTKKKETKESKQTISKKDKKNRKLMNKLTTENKLKPFKENSEVYNQYPKIFNKFKFKTTNYYFDEKGRKKKLKKKRKFKPDDIRKKIKSRFHKTIKNIINENLKKAGSQKLFDFLPQCFVCNISKKANQEVLNLTYKELLEKDFLSNIDESKYKNKSVDLQKYQRNKEVLRYLEENPEICKKSGFDIIQNRKYSDILDIYFLSDQFDNSLKQLENEKESKEYISEYIIRAKNYVKFFSQEDKKAQKNDEEDEKDN